MKKLLLILAVGFLMLVNEACGQSYESMRGTSQDTFAIGNLHWFEIFRDHDSSWVKYKLKVNGIDSIFVFADTNWVKRHSVDTAKKYTWLNDHIFKKVVLIDSLLKFDSLGRMTLPYIASATRQIMLMNGFIKYIDEADSMRTVPTMDYLKDSLVTRFDSVFTKSGQFISLKKNFYLKPADSSGVYFPVFMNDEGMYKYSAGKILYQTNLGIDTVASEEYVASSLVPVYTILDSLGIANNTFAPPLWKIGNQVQLELEEPLYIIASDRLGIRYADSTHAGIITSTDYLLFKSFEATSSLWTLDNPNIIPVTGKILDLRTSKLMLPTTVNDESEFGFTGNKVVYFDNVGQKNLASENWVQTYIDTLPGIGDLTFYTPLFKTGNTVQLLYGDPLYMDGYSGSLLIREANGTYAGIISSATYTTFSSYGSLISALDTRVTSTEQDISGLNGDLSLLITNLATSGSINVHWGNLTNVPSTFTPSSHTHPTTEITYGLWNSLDAYLTSLNGDISAHEDAIIDHDNRIGTLENAGYATQTWVNNTSTPAWSNISGKPSFSYPLVESAGTVSISYHASSPFQTYQNALYMNYSSPLTIAGGILDIVQSSSMTDGYLSSTDWSTFNGKTTVSIGSESLLYTEGGIKFYGRTLTINGTGYTILTSAQAL